MKFKRMFLGCLVATATLSVLSGCGSSSRDSSTDPVLSNRTADVIIAIDSSGSMFDEVGFVENQINTFANTLIANGIDLHIIVIADDAQFCAPAPLGSGSCIVDQNLPEYRHDQTPIGSGDVFNTITATYANWSSSLRTNASKTIIVVTDDDDATMWQTFSADLVALDSEFTGFRLHAFVATLSTLIAPCLGQAIAIGTEYMELVADSGGEENNLCLQDFGPGFNLMAAAVIVDTP